MGAKAPNPAPRPHPIPRVAPRPQSIPGEQYSGSNVPAINPPTTNTLPSTPAPPPPRKK
jgi:hypothetical protein